MMPAKLQDTPSAPAPVESATPPVGGFGRVLNSIQGLQQRLDDFSVDEVIRASAKAETLIQQLSLMQAKLSGLPLLKQVSSEAKHIISEIPEENFELVALSNLEKYPTLNALLTTGHQLQQEVRACPDKPADPEPVVLKALPSPVSQTEPLPAITGLLSAPAERAFEHANSGHADDSPGADAAPEQTTDAPASVTSSDEDDMPGGNGASVRGDSDLDQRLLDDLIKNYGDFTGSPNFTSSSRTPKSTQSKSPKNKTVTANALIKPAAATEAGFHPAKPVDAARSKTAARTKGPPAEIVPILDTQQAKPVEQNVTGSTKHGELDRQLKSIIKDYGENDLYPRQNSLNVKIAGIVAIALLGLVLGGYFLFRTPAPVNSAPANSAAQPDAKFSSGSGTTSKGSGDATGRK